MNTLYFTGISVHVCHSCVVLYNIMISIFVIVVDLDLMFISGMQVSTVLSYGIQICLVEKQF